MKGKPTMADAFDPKSLLDGMDEISGKQEFVRFMPINMIMIEKYDQRENPFPVSVDHLVPFTDASSNTNIHLRTPTSDSTAHQNNISFWFGGFSVILQDLSHAIHGTPPKGKSLTTRVGSSATGQSMLAHFVGYRSYWMTTLVFDDARNEKKYKYLRVFLHGTVKKHISEKEEAVILSQVDDLLDQICKRMFGDMSEEVFERRCQDTITSHVITMIRDNA
jgi:hypothetical protein